MTQLKHCVKFSKTYIEVRLFEFQSPAGRSHAHF